MPAAAAEPADGRTVPDRPALDPVADLGDDTGDRRPRSKLTSPDVPHRPLTNEGRKVQISFEAVWSPDSPLGAHLRHLADTLAAAARPWP
ncbi:hypothetical protein [Streptomyces spinoverrucosus]|uniref:hypothetical protein n=1 Tax=Streptomyces spinoverrucosus TaxID=284043 RepID=UPI0027D9FC19|nr:hypothetical protein [Streptomyces spinoverrucosus]